jgi:formylglycine-generating enzyme required for sulfatase activity
MQSIGNYQIIRELPEDRLGARFVVKHAQTGERGLLRLFSAQNARDPRLLAAIRHAPEMFRQFSHSHASLPRIFDTIDGRAYLISDEAPGDPLLQTLELHSPPWPEAQALDVLRPLADVMDAAHKTGLYHGHPHPGAIFEQDQSVTLSDWGLVWSPEPDSGIFQTIAVEEQALTLAPELLAGNRSPGPEGDRYALASLAYYLLSGGWPYEGENASDRLLAQLTQPPLDPRHHRAGLTEEQAQILMRGVAREPDRRFPSAQAMIQTLESVFLPVWKKIGLTMSSVPAGAFLFGHGQQQFLPDFNITTFPVTVGQFQTFVQETGYVTLAEREGWGLAYNGRIWEKKPGATWRRPYGGDVPSPPEEHPVVQIAYEDAQAFCQWSGLSIPTEEQWEKAARGEDGRLYPWGNDWRPDCCHHARGPRHPVAVDDFSCGASPYGVYHMAGNVWEWTISPYEPGSAYQVLRGGAWPHDARYLTTTFRYYALPAYRSDALGFRCVMASKETVQ